MSAQKSAVRKEPESQDIDQGNGDGPSFNDFQNLSDVESKHSQSQSSQQQFQLRMGYNQREAGEQFYDDRNPEQEFQNLQENIDAIKFNQAAAQNKLQQQYYEDGQQEENEQHYDYNNDHGDQEEQQQQDNYQNNGEEYQQQELNLEEIEAFYQQQQQNLIELQQQQKLFEEQQQQQQQNNPSKTQNNQQNVYDNQQVDAFKQNEQPDHQQNVKSSDQDSQNYRDNNSEQEPMSFKQTLQINQQKNMQINNPTYNNSNNVIPQNQKLNNQNFESNDFSNNRNQIPQKQPHVNINSIPLPKRKQKNTPPLPPTANNNANSKNQFNEKQTQFVQANLQPDLFQKSQNNNQFGQEITDNQKINSDQHNLRTYVELRKQFNTQNHDSNTDLQDFQNNPQNVEHHLAAQYKRLESPATENYPQNDNAYEHGNEKQEYEYNPQQYNVNDQDKNDGDPNQEYHEEYMNSPDQDDGGGFENEYDQQYQQKQGVPENTVEEYIDKISASVLKLKERSEFLSLRENVLKSRKKEIDESLSEMKTFVTRKIEYIKEYILEKEVKFNSDLDMIFETINDQFTKDLDTLRNECSFTNQRFDIYQSVIDTSDIEVICGFCNQNEAEVQELLGQNLSQYFAEQAEYFPSINFRKQDLQQDPDIQNLINNISNFTAGIVEKGESILTQRFQTFIDDNQFSSNKQGVINQQQQAPIVDDKFLLHNRANSINSRDNQVQRNFSDNASKTTQQLLSKFFQRSNQQSTNLFNSGRQTHSPQYQRIVLDSGQQAFTASTIEASPFKRVVALETHNRQQSISNKVQTIQSQLDNLFSQQQTQSSNHLGSASSLGAIQQNSSTHLIFDNKDQITKSIQAFGQQNNSNKQISRIVHASSYFERKNEKEGTDRINLMNRSANNREVSPNSGTNSLQGGSEILNSWLSQDNQRKPLSPQNNFNVTKIQVLHSPSGNRNTNKPSVNVAARGNESSSNNLNEFHSNNRNLRQQTHVSPQRIELRQMSGQRSNSPVINRFHINIQRATQENDDNSFQALNILQQQSQLFQQGKRSFFQ